MHFLSKLKTSIVYAALLLVSASACAKQSQFNLTPGVTPVSRDIYDLHMTIFWICVVIGIGVFGVMFYSLFKYRKSLRCRRPQNFVGIPELKFFGR